MIDASTYIQQLLTAEALRKPLLGSVIEFLRLPPGSHGLDAGCGIGLQAELLADALGPAGRVTGVDILPELLRYGKDSIAKTGPADRIRFCQAGVNRLPYADNSFDWAWSADCIGYPAGALAPVLDELIRVVRPGGRICLLAWTSQQVLPGYPLLEARLNATCSSYRPYLEGKPPGQHFLRAPHGLRLAGLEDVQAKTFVRDIQAPLTEGERAALLSLFEMLWGQPQPEVTPEDWRSYRALCAPASPGLILDLPGYYAFFTYSLFTGSVPRNKPGA